MGNDLVQGGLGAVLGVIMFIIVRELISGLSTSTWGTAEVTMMYTILPLAVAVAAVMAVLAGLRKIMS